MFNIPNLFTAANMLCGVTAIFLSVAGRIDLAPFAIFLGAILDFLDGFLARLLKQQGELGKQLDSLADMITFGLAPGVMMLVLLTWSVFPHELLPGGTISDSGIKAGFEFDVRHAFNYWLYAILEWKDFSWIPLTALFIPFMSMFRLAKFNIDTRQSESFIGLPTPANTIFFTAFPLLLASGYEIGEDSFIRMMVSPAYMIPVIAIMSLLLLAATLVLYAIYYRIQDSKRAETRARKIAKFVDMLERGEKVYD